MKCMSKRSVVAVLLAAAVLLVPVVSEAQFGGVVYDPTNYSNAVLRYQQLQQHLVQLQQTVAKVIHSKNPRRIATNLPNSFAVPPHGSARRKTNQTWAIPNSWFSTPLTPLTQRTGTRKPYKLKQVRKKAGNTCLLRQKVDTFSPYSRRRHRARPTMQWS